MIDTRYLDEDSFLSFKFLNIKYKFIKNFLCVFNDKRFLNDFSIWLQNTYGTFLF